MGGINMKRYKCIACNLTIIDEDLKFCPNCGCSINGDCWNEYETVKGFDLEDLAIKLNKMTKENSTKIITTSDNIDGTITALVKLKSKIGDEQHGRKKEEN